MFKRIGVMGAGSMGTVLGAFLTRAGLDITMIDANKAHVDALNANGAKIIGAQELTVPVKACVPEEMEGEFDLFFYLVKQTYNDVAIPQMIKHCHKDTYIAVGSNGLPELAMQEYWPKEKIIGFPISWAAAWVEPGVTMVPWTEDDSTFEFHVGSVEGPITPAVLEVQKILQMMCPKRTYLTESLMSDRWSKVMINASWSGMSTVVNGTFADAINIPESAVCLARIGRETVRTCHAMGIHFPVMYGAEYDKILDFDGEEGQNLVIETVKKAIGKNTSRASMLQDLEKGKKCEIKMINGVVSEAAKKVGIPTPYCDAVVKIVSEIEEGKRTLSVDNLKDMPVLPI